MLFKKMTITLALVSSCIPMLLTGCAGVASQFGKERPFNYTQATLPASAQSKAHQKVSVVVNDMRSGKVSPYLVSSYNVGDQPMNPVLSGSNLHYNATQPFATIYQNALVSSLQQAGYDVTSGAGKTIEADIQRTNSSRIPEGWNDGISTTIQSTILVKKGNSVVWQKTYTLTEQAARKALSTDASPLIFSLTNTVLNKLCVNLLSDPGFKKAMAS